MSSVCESGSLPSSRLATIYAESGGVEQPYSGLSAPCNQESEPQPVLVGPVLCLIPDLQTGICPHNTCKDNCAVDTRSGRSGWLSGIAIRQSRQVVLPYLKVLGEDVGTGDSELSAPELRASGLITDKVLSRLALRTSHVLTLSTYPAAGPIRPGLRCGAWLLFWF